ncbi:hypothetical protein Q7C_790 [Methylophaga frappieri]|uniref:Uncharacterized protein n=2 Tax=Methylophaga frappieri (strain ATCC BAA-2434 / DSM 25690 / JAM7) TaxID=754477 RepID=I1YGB6_METFJ|nr:hypothetical protein Q7C_790 [Methylophaga frappieri]
MVRIQFCNLRQPDAKVLHQRLLAAAATLNTAIQLLDEPTADIVIIDLNRAQQSRPTSRPANQITIGIAQHKSVNDANIEIVFKSIPNQQELVNLLTQAMQQPRPKKMFRHYVKRLRPGNWIFRSGPDSRLPPLIIDCPPIAIAHTGDTLTSAGLIVQWLEQLPSDPNLKITTLLNHLQQLAGAAISQHQRLLILEKYLPVLADLLLNRNPAVLKTEAKQNEQFQKFQNQLIQTLEVTSHHYMRIAQRAYQAGRRPDKDPIYHYCLNRWGQLLGWQILKAYQQFRQPPKLLIKQLHQLYLYQEAADTLHQPAVVKSLQNLTDYHRLYCQILLTGLADPYRLPAHAISRIYQYLESLTPNISTGKLPASAKSQTSSSLLQGKFIIDCENDALPVAAALLPTAQRQAAHLRLFDTQPFIQQLKQTLQTQQAALGQLPLQQYQDLLDRLQQTHLRQTQRNPLDSAQPVMVLFGLQQIIHHQNHNGSNTPENQWHWLNQSPEGSLLSYAGKKLTANNQDLIAIIDLNDTLRLGFICWLCHYSSDTRIGVKLLPGDFEFGHCTAITEHSQKSPAILATNDQKTCLLTPKGWFTTDRKLIFHSPQRDSHVHANALRQSTLDYDYFTCKVSKIS